MHLLSRLERAHVAAAEIVKHYAASASAAHTTGIPLGFLDRRLPYSVNRTITHLIQYY